MAAGGNSDARLVDANSGSAGGAVVAAVTAAVLEALYGRLYPPIGFAQAIPRPPEGMIRPSNGDVAFVGGMAIGGAPPPFAPLEPPRRRGAALKPKAPNRCRVCIREGRSDQDALHCRGAVANARARVFYCSRRNAAAGACAGGAATGGASGGAAGAAGAGAVGGVGGGAAAAVGGS